MTVEINRLNSSKNISEIKSLIFEKMSKIGKQTGNPQKEMENIKWQTWNSTAENIISEKKKMTG